MPIVSSLYRPSLLLRNGHLATIYAGLVRKVPDVLQKRERIQLSDGDFLDLDWSYGSAEREQLVILLHGLEGNAQRPYIMGTAHLFNKKGFDVCAVNFRGCSGEPNKLYRSYHSGATEDLIEVIQHVLNSKNYSKIYLKGFSLGGNLLLKYLGEKDRVPKEIKAAVAISVPCNLEESANEIMKPKNILYAARFKKNLLAKLQQKQLRFPDLVKESDIAAVKTLLDFDDFYTSRAHGFKNGLDYYTKCSSLQFLQSITVPSLIINARDDSFLGESCYPFKKAEKCQNLYLEVPKYGGHVGFWGQNNITYTEKRALDFFIAN